MDLVIFEENKPFVLQALGNGDFDYIESASEVYEAEFFRFIKANTNNTNLPSESRIASLKVITSSRSFVSSRELTVMFPACAQLAS